MSEMVAKPDSEAPRAMPGAKRGHRLVGIAVATLRPLAQLEFDLFALAEQGGDPILYRQRDYPLEQSDIDRLIGSGVQQLYITELGHLKYEQYLEAHLTEFLEDEHTPLEVRCRFLHDAASNMLKNALQILNVDRTVEVAHRLGREVAALIGGRSLWPMDLFYMLRHDPHLLTHTINVSMYSTLLAHRMGVTDKLACEEIATGALLHDLGLRHLPRTVLDHESQLNPRERQQLQRHPQNGFEELRQRGDVTWGQLMMVYQHHERCDGSGYPVRIDAEEIHWMARLCSVVDTFDLMSRPRKDSKPLLVPDIISYLSDAAGKQYDREMVSCWIH